MGLDLDEKEHCPGCVHPIGLRCRPKHIRLKLKRRARKLKTNIRYKY